MSAEVGGWGTVHAARPGLLGIYDDPPRLPQELSADPPRAPRRTVDLLAEAADRILDLQAEVERLTAECAALRAQLAEDRALAGVR